MRINTQEYEDGYRDGRGLFSHAVWILVGAIGGILWTLLIQKLL